MNKHKQAQRWQDHEQYPCQSAPSVIARERPLPIHWIFLSKLQMFCLLQCFCFPNSNKRNSSILICVSHFVLMCPYAGITPCEGRNLAQRGECPILDHQLINKLWPPRYFTGRFTLAWPSLKTSTIGTAVFYYLRHYHRIAGAALSSTAIIVFNANRKPALT